MARSAVVAAGFAFAISLGEFGATVFVARGDHPTVPIAIYRFLGSPGASESRPGDGDGRHPGRAHRHRRAHHRPLPSTGGVIVTDIRLDSVRVAYGTEPVVRDVSFAVGSGQCLAVLRTQRLRQIHPASSHRRY